MTPPQVRGGVVSFWRASMENRRDPLELWVGSWSPEDIIDEEAKRLAGERRTSEAAKREDETSEHSK